MTGINHAIWAGMVSGAMNARALWWNDGYAIYDPGGRAMALNSMKNSATAELPAANFARDVDFAGLKPMTISYAPGTKIWGASLGNETSAIGWFRDANSEPPNWSLLPVVSGQTITINLPGSAANWKVDFYDTKTGSDITSSITAARKAKSITIKLPDFVDDIAFKMKAQ
jgi:hypothetical protein